MGGNERAWIGVNSPSENLQNYSDPKLLRIPTHLARSTASLELFFDAPHHPILS